MIDFFKINKKIILLNYVFITCLLCIIAYRGINMGIDFIGGVVIEINTPQQTNTIEIKNILGLNSNVQNVTNKNNFLINFKIPPETDAEMYIKNIQNKLSTSLQDVSFLRTDYVGPNIGKDLLFSGIAALFFALLGMFVYLVVRFNVYFALGGILALINDIIVVLGFFSITQLEFSISSVAALLTIIGYSINDSVVVYDKIREVVSSKKIKGVENIINNSINIVLRRTVMTSLTTLVAILVLIFFMKNTIADFSWPMFVGIIAGTASSIFIAPAFPSRSLQILDKKKLKEQTNYSIN